ncbi:metal-transporting ATPase [Noviherbaspirillum denitrificans]|uniref:P-type Ca(2+) transporter n=1 Tax=Noviherbaspirillum denitrificans TaxID=1968433 RepID=A0A254TJN7_9BURK|nr:metal-transporting ATPase [Noviherbaspirillum denitrificans]
MSASPVVDHSARDPAAALQQLQVQRETGLDAEQVRQRSMNHGFNRLPEAAPRSSLAVFLAQFRGILILILIGAAGLAAAIGNVKDAVVILCVVFINALVGYYQEHRAEQSLAALRRMLPLRTRVRRAGEKHEISVEDVVPGDIVLLEAGDRVPADGRFIFVAGVEVDESALTGESHPVVKNVNALPPGVPLAERINMAYMNTMLTRGRAEVVVTATGVDTEMGRLSQELAEAAEAPTPLQVQLDQLGKRLGGIALALVGLLSFLEFLRGTDLAHIALDAIALAVAAMPEGLPVVVTVTLALGMHNMARHRTIVKRLASVETLGCTTVIFSDKTGTLTLNQMTARAFLYREQEYIVSGEGYQLAGDIRAVSGSAALPDLRALLIPLVACNDSHVANGQTIGDPMEAALLVLAQKGGIDPAAVASNMSRIAEVPFDSAHKFMATFHEDAGVLDIFVKGAPDVLLARSGRILTAGGERPMEPEDRARIEAHYRAFAERGLRGLMIASRRLPRDAIDAEVDVADLVHDLTFVGIVGLMDPPRPEAKDAIAECKKAGITVKIITGDHPLTAAAIAGELGIHGRAITGSELDGMDSDALAAVIDEVTVFARVTPAHKVKLVRSLQRKEHVVAMTGDGVNDAPALKTADIGVAMGTAGTAVAKEAAAMVLTDDNFATLVHAVRQGRTLYDNILKFVRFQLSTTIGAILTVFFAPLAGLPEPFTAVQILWVALIMDGPPAVSLALDSARPGIMQDPPRHRNEPVLPFARLGKIIAYGTTMMVGTLGVMHYGLQAGMEQRALTLAFTTFVLFQFFNVFNARVERGTAFNKHFFENRMLWASLVGVLLLQALAVNWSPAQSVFGTHPLTLQEWGIAAAVASAILWLEEGRKFVLKLAGKVCQADPVIGTGSAK